MYILFVITLTCVCVLIILSICTRVNGHVSYLLLSANFRISALKKSQDEQKDREFFPLIRRKITLCTTCILFVTLTCMCVY